jgi:HD-like signal output (HDOD) protein/CheY-like chemotaxis protein
MKRILFVDDEINILDGIRRMLHADRTRWEMQFALSGAAALKACEAQSFDVVISDMRMPGMDGATLLGHIRDRFPSTARIVLSGYSEADLAARVVPMAHRVLTKPCVPSELQKAIDSVCALQEILGRPAIQKVIGTVSELPSLSSTYRCLIAAVKDPNTPIKKVADIIERDVAMSAKVLQLANSAFFGMAQKVTNVPDAATYLGMATIKNLAFVSEAFKAFVPDRRIPHSVCETMQKHAYQTTAVAAVLPLDKEIRDVTVLAALLHDIGVLFLASAMPADFCTILTQAKESGCRTFEAEEKLLGTSHAEIGAYLLGLWGIPNLAVEAIAHHHHPTRIPHLGLDTTVAVYVADLLAHELEAYPMGAMGKEIAEVDRANLESLGLLPRFDEFRELALQSCH